MFAYVFEYDGVVTQCNPSGRWALKSNVPEGCAAFRTQLSGELIFTHDDYEFLKSIENDNPYNEIVFVIYEDSIEKWRGSFSLVTCKVSDYHGVYRCTPVVIDKYTEMLGDWEREQDIMKKNIARRDFAIVEESGFEYKTIVNIVNLFENNGFNYRSGDWYANNVLLPLGQFWNGFISTKYLGFTTDREYYMPALYNDELLTSLFIPLIRNGYGAAYLPAGSLSQQWLYVKGIYRHLGGNSYEVTTLLARKIDITIDVEGVAVMPTDDATSWDLGYSEAVTIQGQPGRKWYMKATKFQSKYNPHIFTFRSGVTVEHYMELSSKKIVDRSPRYLKDVMAWFAKQYNLHKEVDVGMFTVDVINSELLTNAVNPVTGEDRNPLYYAMLVHNAEILGDVEVGRQGLKKAAPVSLKQLLLSICTNFNARWDIVDGYLTIEHITHWLDLAASQDLTLIENGIYTDKLQNYEYTGDEVPRKEVLKYKTLAEQIEFDGVPIEYAAYNTAGDDTTKTSTIEAYAASIDKVIDSSSKDGLTLVLVEYVPSGVKIITIGGPLPNPVTVEVSYWKPIFRPGIITGLWYINEPMTVSRIEDDYFKYFRPLQLGKMNIIDENFTESGYIKRQDEIKVPIDINTIAQWKLYKTKLGYGRCTGFEYDSVSRIVSLNLIFKTNV